MIYAYAICEPPIAVSCSRDQGLGVAQLRALQSGGVAAVYSRHRSLRVRPQPAQVLKHERVIEQMMTRGPVLPLRFGTQLETEQQLAATLDQRGEELWQALDRVRGRVELGLRVIPEDSTENCADARPRSGRDILLARVRDHQRAVRVAHDLHAPLAGFAAASSVHPYPRPPAILVASYLVNYGRVDAFRRHADQLAVNQEPLRVLITGSWPPYSFVTAERR